MLRPPELMLNLPMVVANGELSNTTKVWDTLIASKNGELDTVKRLASECPGIIYAQYNYTPPIHFAVREGHADLTRYLLDHGAHNPDYKTYPFLDNLATIALERGHRQIATWLEQYNSNRDLCKFSGDNGEIHYNKSEEQEEFQRAVNHNEIEKAKQILERHPEFSLDPTASWSEGILMMPSNRKNFEMLNLLIAHGARVPEISKWGRAYYFKHFEVAKFLLENGMHPDHHTWHHVTLLHDMAEEGNVAKAELLVKAGASIDPIEEEYQSTPLGLAARWGYINMVDYLIKQGADVNKAGEAWATPLEWSKKHGHIEIEKMLRSAGAEE
jgi:ankyrin repeat protein